MPVTLILGLGRDVGIANARRLLDGGHKLVVTDPDEARIARLSSDLPQGGLFQADRIDNRLGIRNALAAALEAHGRVDNLVMIPPIPPGDSLAELDLGSFDRAVASSVRACTLALSLFRTSVMSQSAENVEQSGRPRQRGSVVFILGLAARFGNRGRFTETVTQSALTGIVKAASIELAPDKIRCNSVMALRPRAEEDSTEKKWLKDRTPLRRAALADEIAEAVAFLLSPNTAIITGETLVLDGGRSTLGGLMRVPED